MKKILSSVASFFREEDGATAVEYGILVAAIAAVIILVTIAVGQQVENAFARVCNALRSINASVNCPT